MSQSKKTNQRLLRSINTLFQNHRLLRAIPVVVGNDIYISNFIIAKEESDYAIYDVETKRCIGVCLSKDGAIAFTRDTIAKSGNKKKIKELDAELAKAENDVVFYTYSLSTTEDEINKSSTQSRLEESKAIIDRSKGQLRDIIFHNDK